MLRETHAGRKITARDLKGLNWGYCTITVNGEDWGRRTGTAAEAVRLLAIEFDAIDAWTTAHGIDGDRWDAKYFPPGTFELCPEGHPRDIGGLCVHSWCVRERERDVEAAAARVAARARTEPGSPERRAAVEDLFAAVLADRVSS